MTDLPAGITEVGRYAVDHCPRIGIKDCLRKIRDAVASGAEVEDPESLAEAEVGRQASAWSALLFSPANTGECLDTPNWTHRAAADAIRVRMIERLRAAHKPPPSETRRPASRTKTPPKTPPARACSRTWKSTRSGGSTRPPAGWAAPTRPQIPEGSP